MKRIKRILAIIGLVIIIGLFASTLILGLFGNENTFDLFKISLFALIVVPVLIWAYTFIYKLLSGRNERGERFVQAAPPKENEAEPETEKEDSENAPEPDSSENSDS